MPLPTLTKTWNFDVNNASQGVPVSTPDSELKWGQTWVNIKDGMVGISPGWSVAGSGALGAGGGGGMDAVDRWTTGSDVVSNQSWIVLQNNAIKTGFQVLFRVDNNGGGWDGAGLRLAVSPGGLYTGGSQTVLPTATDEILLRDTDVNNDAFPETPHWHLMMSSDGTITRLFFHWGASSRAYFAFEVPVNTVSGWADPWVIVAGFAGGDVPVTTYTNFNDNTTYTFAEAPGPITMKLYFTSEGWVSAMAGQNMTYGNDLEGGEFPMAPIGLASATSGARGRHGELVDIWWASTINTDTAHYPDTLPRQFLQVGDIIVPWDQTAGGVLKT